MQIGGRLTAKIVPIALQREVDLGFEGPDDAIALAEPVLIAELLKKLLSNAIAYAGRGAIVTVRVKKEPGVIILEVEDNGPGLSAKQMEEVTLRKCSPPMRARSALKDQEAGYCLGLAIKFKMALLFDAEIQLQDRNDGRGLLTSV